MLVMTVVEKGGVRGVRKSPAEFLCEFLGMMVEKTFEYGSSTEFRELFLSMHMEVFNFFKFENIYI